MISGRRRMLREGCLGKFRDRRILDIKKVVVFIVFVTNESIILIVTCCDFPFIMFNKNTRSQEESIVFIDVYWGIGGSWRKMRIMVRGELQCEQVGEGSLVNR